MYLLQFRRLQYTRNADSFRDFFCELIFSFVGRGILIPAMKCPVCQAELKIADRSGIEIDYCPTCRGVWLDRGELDKIIERALQEGSGGRTPPPRASTRPYEYEGQSYEYIEPRHAPKRRKRRNWLEELFDVFD